MNLLVQLQAMLGSLRELEKRYYDTAAFAGAYRDYDGLAINTGVQMDVDEFFNLLFEKLELALRRTDQPSLLKSLFGGETVNQARARAHERVWALASAARARRGPARGSRAV